MLYRPPHLPNYLPKAVNYYIILPVPVAEKGSQLPPGLTKLWQSQKSASTLGKEGTERWLSSTLQDLLKGRASETSYLNGYVARKGREVGVPTPINDTIISMMREIEQGKREKMSPSNFEMLKQYMR